MTLLLTLWLAQASAAEPSLLPEGPRAGATPSASDDARARELYENGALLYDEGRYEDAVAAWTEAYRLSGRPLLLFNMANASERLGRYEEAMALLSRYRAFAPAEERETLDRRIRNIEARLTEQESARAAEPIPPPSVSTARTTRRGVRVAPIVLGGVGVAAIGTGTAFGLRATDAREAAAADCVDVGGIVRCGEAAGPALANDRRSSLVADLCFGAGALSLAGAVVTAVLPGRSTTVSGGVGPRGGWLTVGGAF